MNPMFKNTTKQAALAAVQSKHVSPDVGGNEPILVSGSLAKGYWFGTVAGREPSAPTADSLRLTAEESESFLRVVEGTSRIKCHHELLLLLQGEVQRFIPHQILISAWGDFRGSNLKFDVVSSMRGVRTRQLNGCGIERRLKELFARWVANGRRPMLQNEAEGESIAASICNDCTLHSAMRVMRSTLVHGFHDERDGIDSLYLALNPRSIMNRHNSERFFFLVDSLITQIDIAFRKVAVLKSADGTACEFASRGSGGLSVREREIINWIAEGKTNVEIAEILGISSFTVKNHVQRIFRKLNAANRTEAVAKSIPLLLGDLRHS